MEILVAQVSISLEKKWERIKQVYSALVKKWIRKKIKKLGDKDW